MTTAASVFVIQLARASRKANKIVRHLARADREDILGSALAWCWEHRESYSLTTTLDTWFVNAVRDAFKQWRRGELRNGAEMLDEIPTGDTTLATVEAWEAATKLAAALPPEYRRVAQLDAQGWTREEMMGQEGISHDAINEARARIKQMRRLLPDSHEYRRAIRATRAPNSDDARAPSAIDREIEELEMMPRHGADCPPCWKCKWFEGYLPGAHKRVGMVIQEPEVAAAVAANEARKLEIAKRVRAGTLRG